MATTILTPSAPARKAPKAIYATIDETHGILTQDDATGAIYFLPDDGELILFTKELATNTVTHGEVGLADTTRLLEDMRGGLAAIACNRYAGLFLETPYAPRHN